MSPEKRKEIARKGNAAMREKGLVHKYTSESGAKAGRKGGTEKAHPENKILKQLSKFEDDPGGVLAFSPSEFDALNADEE